MVFNGSNGSIGSIFGVQWTCSMDPMGVQWIHLSGSNGHNHQTWFGRWTSVWYFCSLDPLCPLDPMDPLCPLNTIGHVHWIHWIHCTLCPLDPLRPMDPLCLMDKMDPLDPMDTMCNGSNGHVQWCSMDPMDPLDPMDTMDPMNKNTSLMSIYQTMFGDCVHWIHSDGSIEHPLDPLNMSIEHQKWIQWIHWIHWTPLDIFTDGHHVQWMSIGCPMDVHWTCPLDMMDPMDPLDKNHNSCDTFTACFKVPARFSTLLYLLLFVNLPDFQFNSIQFNYKFLQHKTCHIFFSGLYIMKHLGCAEGRHQVKFKIC